MPTYQYACTACGHQLEAVQSFTDEPLAVCPACEGRLRKVFSAVGIVFKGSGFYRTDSRSEKSGSEKSGADKSGSDKSGADKSGSSTVGAGKDTSSNGSTGSSSDSAPKSTSTGASTGSSSSSSTTKATATSSA